MQLKDNFKTTLPQPVHSPKTTFPPKQVLRQRLAADSSFGEAIPDSRNEKQMKHIEREKTNTRMNDY